MWFLETVLLVGSIGLVQAGAAPADAQITLAPSAASPALADLDVVANYKGIFNTWRVEAQHRGPRRVCTMCSCCLQCCPAGGWLIAPTSIPSPNTDTTTPTLTNSGQHAQITASSHAAIHADLEHLNPQASINCYLCPECCAQDEMNISASPSVQIPATATAMPTRTTIYPQTRKSSHSGNGVAAGDDITETYYDFSLVGHHPNVIPLILEDNLAEPVTVLSFGNTTTRDNFIAASLVEQLNLTSRIDQAKQNSQAVQPVFGAGAQSLGSINLNVLAGRNDRKFFGITFNVFEHQHQQHSSENDAVMGTAEAARSLLQADVIVGLDFLNQGAALKLSDEYLGVGVRQGLGVVVQRVLMPAAAAGKNMHDNVTQHRIDHHVVQHQEL